MKTDSVLCADLKPAPEETERTHRMAYVEWGTPSPKPAVVCVHGLTRNGRDFDRLAERLERSGRHVLCPDIVGRGKSDWLYGHPEFYNYDQYIGDITTLLKAKDVKQFDWVGTSMGGLIGMIMASSPETLMRRMVLNDVGPFIPLAALKRIASYVGMVIEFAGTAQLERHIRQIYAPFDINCEEDWRHIVEHSYRRLPNGKLMLAHDPAIAQNFARLEEDVDLWKYYDAITCPTLLLRGETSDVLSAEVAEEMTRRGPKAKLITYKGIGHAPSLMEEGQIADIAEFILE